MRETNDGFVIAEKDLERLAQVEMHAIQTSGNCVRNSCGRSRHRRIPRMPRNGLASLSIGT